MRVDGVDVEAYEVVLSLDVTALKGSVPNEWVRDFKQVRNSVYICFAAAQSFQNLQSLQLCMQALGPYGELHLNQKGQLNEIYTGLGAARCASEHT